MASSQTVTSQVPGSPAQRERRRRILEAAVTLSSRGGFEHVQMRAVAEQADVALGTLYRYFPSKIHLLVSVLGQQLGDALRSLVRTPMPGDTSADRVRYALGRTTRKLQRDPHLTEALTRAFVFADNSVSAEIRVVERHVTLLLLAAMRDVRDLAILETLQPSERELAVTKVIGDVWLASLMQWVTGRETADDVAASLDVAVRLLLAEPSHSRR